MIKFHHCCSPLQKCFWLPLGKVHCCPPPWKKSFRRQC